MQLHEIAHQIELKSAAILEKSNEADTTQDVEKLETILSEVKTLGQELETLEAKKAEAEKLAELRARAQANVTTATKSVNMPVFSGIGGGLFTGTETKGLNAQDQRLIRNHAGSIKSFIGETEHEKKVSAYSWMHWLAATQFGLKASLDFCERAGIEVKAAMEGQNLLGGALVPPQFVPSLILLREKYGKFRPNAYPVLMTGDTASRPRQIGGVTAYWVNEGQTITDSQQNYDQINLSAKTLSSLVYMSSELTEDSFIPMGDKTAADFAHAFAKSEDEAGFNGDGTSNYGHITGVRTKLADLYGTGGGVGLVLGAGNAYSELTLANFNDVKACLPEYAETDENSVKWYCRKNFYHSVMEKLALAAGGVSAAEVAAGRRQPLFMGFPVEFVQAFPSTAANSQVPVLFGNLSLAADFGDRRQNTIETSREYKFAQRQIAMRADQRIDINVHDVGSSSEAGPVVGLIMAAA